MLVGFAGGFAGAVAEGIEGGFGDDFTAGEGIVRFGGPYCSTGREDGGAGGFGSLMAYSVASKTWGSMVMVTWPSLVMLSLGGFFELSMAAPFFLEGFVQYFSNMSSVIHF